MRLVCRYFDNTSDVRWLDGQVEPSSSKNARELSDNLKRFDGTDPFLQFIHLSDYDNISNEIDKWSSTFRLHAVVIVYSGAGVPEQVRSQILDARDLYMPGRIFVYLSKFDSPGAIDGWRSDMYKIVSHAEGRANCGTYKDTFVPEEFGCLGLHEETIIDVILSVLTTIQSHFWLNSPIHGDLIEMSEISESLWARFERDIAERLSTVPRQAKKIIVERADRIIVNHDLLLFTQLRDELLEELT